MITLMRHSFAVSADFQITDEARWLSAKGRVAAKQAGHSLADSLADSIDCIVCSPLVRTVQTAELVAGVLAAAGRWRLGEIRSMECLRSEMSPQRALEALQGLRFASILAITHEPIISHVSALLGGQGAGFHPAEFHSFDPIL